MQSPTTKTWIAFIGGMALAAMVFLVYMLADQRELSGNNSLSPIHSSTHTGAQQTHEALLQAIHELSIKIDGLSEAIGKGYYSGNIISGGDALEKTKLEPPSSKLEEQLERLVKTLNHSAFSSERNTMLRSEFERQSSVEPREISSLWQTNDAAKKGLFMCTYSQVLAKLGPPLSISTFSDSIITKWNYPDGSIKFVDGYVTNFSCAKLR